MCNDQLHSELRNTILPSAFAHSEVEAAVKWSELLTGCLRDAE